MSGGIQTIEQELRVLTVSEALATGSDALLLDDNNQEVRMAQMDEILERSAAIRMKLTMAQVAKSHAAWIIPKQGDLVARHRVEQEIMLCEGIRLYVHLVPFSDDGNDERST